MVEKNVNDGSASSEDSILRQKPTSAQESFRVTGNDRIIEPLSANRKLAIALAREENSLTRAHKESSTRPEADSGQHSGSLSRQLFSLLASHTASQKLEDTNDRPFQEQQILRTGPTTTAHLSNATVHTGRHRPQVSSRDPQDASQAEFEKFMSYLMEMKYRSNNGMRTEPREHGGAQLEPGIHREHRSTGPYSVSRSTSSSGTRSRRRRVDPVYDHVENITNTLDYRCKACHVRLGQKNATRFKVHCVEFCESTISPVKEQLRLSSRSKKLGAPRSRSHAGLAAERVDRNEIEDPSSAVPGTRSAKYSSENPREYGHQRPPVSSRPKKKQKTLHQPSQSQCSPQQADDIIDALMEAIIVLGLPFSAFDKNGNQASPLTRALQLLNPDFARQYLPTSSAIGGRLLDRFYAKIHAAVKSRIAEALECGYASVIFDGWDDVNSASVVNVLLRMEGSLTSVVEFTFCGLFTLGLIQQELLNMLKSLSRLWRSLAA